MLIYVQGQIIENNEKIKKLCKNIQSVFICVKMWIIRISKIVTN